VHTHDLTNMNHTIPKLYDVSGISLGWKCWQTNAGIVILLSQWGNAAPHPLSPQGKNWTPHECMLRAFSLAGHETFIFQNCLSSLLAWANGRGTTCET
jgi:hypothetical protein